MAAYLFVQIKMTSGKGWPEYRAAVDTLAEKFGGRYIVRGAVEIEVLEGTHDGRRLVVFEFPSMVRSTLSGIRRSMSRQEAARRRGRPRRVGGAGGLSPGASH